jgi:hypothetical protein
MLVIVCVGFVVAWVAGKFLTKALSALGFDRWCDRLGVTAAIRKGSIWSKPSEATGSGAFVFLLVIAVMVGLGTLNVPTIDELVSQFFLYLPRVFSALAVLALGYLLAGFIARAALISSVNAGYRFARLISASVRLILLLLFLAMALEQLQVAPGVVVAAFSIVFGGMVIALAIAFGVGGIPAARRMIEKDGERKEEGGKINHL